MRALETGQLPKSVEGKTMADSIDVDAPRNWRKAVNAMRNSEGKMVGVTDEQILDAIRLGGRHGVFAEPAAAAALAGVVAAIDDKTISASDRVLVMVTGSGLKDTRSALRACGGPIKVAPDLTAIEQAEAES
jgi:threonine synthase